MATTLADQTPRVWIGCLHCYNSGYLVGDWFDAAGADQVSLNDVHAATSRLSKACEELWCLDHEYVPVDGEFGPLEAAEWGSCFEEARAELWPAVCAWVRSGSYVAEGRGDLPSISDFQERYAGHWDTFKEYAEQLAEETGLQQGWPEEATRYFDWTRWVADLAHDYAVLDAPADQGYGVYVFRNL